MGESDLSHLALYSARPTLRIDGQDNAMASGLLQSLVMREQEGALSSLEACFVNFTARDTGQVGLATGDATVNRDAPVLCGRIGRSLNCRSVLRIFRS